MYNPKEDSFFLSETLKDCLKNKEKTISILDLGTGSGIQAETCIKRGFMNVLASDIDKKAVRFVKNKGIKSKMSDLFGKIKEKFDLVVFNPPYLPEDSIDKQKDTTGGKTGDEIILRFLKQAKNHLTAKGRVLLLLSSLTPRKRINKAIKQHYKKTKLAEKTIFFEKLEVWLMMDNSADCGK